MSKKDRLFQVADRQQGYFTSLQAEECGYARSHFKRSLSPGNWTKEARGVYRLAHYPVTDRPELVVWSLWSRSKQGHIQGVWSHETALDVYELSDVMPSKMHMTVPLSFRKKVSIPSVLVLHYANLQKHEIRSQQGYFITTPFRTLIDVFEENVLSYDLLLQVLKEALQRGMVSKSEIETTELRSKIRIALNEIKI